MKMSICEYKWSGTLPHIRNAAACVPSFLESDELPDPQPDDFLPS